MPTMTYNPDVLRELYPEDDDFRQLAGLIASDLRKRVDALTSSLAANDQPTAVRSAHSIAGVAGSAMAEPLALMGRKMEELLRAGGSPDVPALAARIKAEADAVIGVLQARIAA